MINLNPNVTNPGQGLERLSSNAGKTSETPFAETRPETGQHGQSGR